MKKKVLAALVTTAMVASMFSGCGNDSGNNGDGSNSGNGGAPASDNSSSQEESPAEDKGASGEADGGIVTLRIVDWESDTMNDAMQEAFDNVFSKEHPNIKVEIIKGSYSDYGQAVRGMITAGEAPDVFQLGYDQACSFYRMNLLTDWADKVAQEPEFVENFYGGTMQG